MFSITFPRIIPTLQLNILLILLWFMSFMSLLTKLFVQIVFINLWCLIILNWVLLSYKLHVWIWSLFNGRLLYFLFLCYRCFVMHLVLRYRLGKLLIISTFRSSSKLIQSNNFSSTLIHYIFWFYYYWFKASWFVIQKGRILIFWFLRLLFLFYLYWWLAVIALS